MNLDHLIHHHIRVLITGVTSIHGWPIYRELTRYLKSGHIYATGSPKMSPGGDFRFLPVCITDRDEFKKLADTFRPTHIIHCGGVCDLDVCEARPGWAKQMNEGGARVIRDLFSESCHITYVSSDLVFSGITPPESGYREDHIPDPISVVGHTYVDAETIIATCHNHCIIRLGLPLGDSYTGDKGPIDWIESRFKRKLPVTLFYDEWRSCITCHELSHKVLSLVFNEATGLYHCGGQHTMSLYDIGQMVLKKGNYPETLLKRESRLNDLKGPPRIGDVSLDSSKLAKFLHHHHVTC